MQTDRIPGDGHRLREWRLQRSQRLKITTKPSNRKGLRTIDARVQRSFLMGDRKTIQISNITTVCFSVAVPLAETTQDRDTYD
jgi:hypothetical protein